MPDALGPTREPCHGGRNPHPFWLATRPMLSVRWRRILVGDVAVADVRFDPNRESGARGKNAVITLDDEEGWRISNMGAGAWLVNQTPVAPSQSHRLRSEDLVRASEAGPDFCFRLVAGPHGCAIPATTTRTSVAERPVPARQEVAIPPSPPAPLPEGEGSMREAGLFERLIAAIARVVRPSATKGAEESKAALTPASLPTNLRSGAGEGGSGKSPTGFGSRCRRTGIRSSSPFDTDRRRGAWGQGESGTGLAPPPLHRRRPRLPPVPRPAPTVPGEARKHAAACAAVMEESPVRELGPVASKSLPLRRPNAKENARDQPLSRLIGIMVSGLLGLFALTALGVGSAVRRTITFIFFYKSAVQTPPPSPPALSQ